MGTFSPPPYTWFNLTPGQEDRHLLDPTFSPSPSQPPHPQAVLDCLPALCLTLPLPPPDSPKGPVPHLTTGRQAGGLFLPRDATCFPASKQLSKTWQAFPPTHPQTGLWAFLVGQDTQHGWLANNFNLTLPSHPHLPVHL